MSDLISGKDAFDVAYNGGDAEWRWKGKEDNWRELKPETAFSINELKGYVCEFRIKPKIITLNGVEIPAQFEPKDGEVVWHLFPTVTQGYGWCEYEEGCSFSQFGTWRTEAEIKQVVEALRNVFGGNTN